MFLKRNITKVTNFKIEVYTIRKIHLGNVFIFKTEKIFFGKFFISTIEGLTDTGITTFHQFFDANVFDNIDKLWWNLTILNPIFIGSIKSMSNFMSDKHIIYFITRFFPHRKSQNSCLDIKAGSLYFPVLNHKVFRSKKFGKL